MLDDMKSKFVANVSHELRTPLTSIKNACSILKKFNNSKDAVTEVSVSDLLNIIDSNVDRQVRLVNDLLDLSKIEKGKIQLSRSLMNIEGVAREVIASLDILAKAKGIHLELKAQPGLFEIYASRDQMLEVFTNLIDNAIKYTPGGGSILVEIENEDNGIKIIVSDTGIGMEHDEMEKIFDRFKRLEAIFGHKTKGTGLGLAITKEIIDSHGGCIWVESQVAKGSKFILTLPIGLRGVDKK
jgi:signal transduction histidine kinase